VLDFCSKLSGIENAFAAHLQRARANLVDSACSSRHERFRDPQIKRIESIIEDLIQHPSITPRDHAWLNVLVLVCVQG
jgi:hypothetical protein